MERGISFGTATGRSDLFHNTRKQISDNIDVSRIKDNVILKRETLKSAYGTCFGQSQEEYNAKQKRKDRKINDYFKHLFGISAYNPQKTRNVITGKNGNQSYYENVIQIGDMFDTGIKSNPQAAELAKQALMTYFNGYAERNPQFYVFDAVIHMDESAPQLHLCYIPWATDYQNGMSVQHSHDKALNVIRTMVNREREVFREICKSYGLEPREKEDEKGRGRTYTTYEYTAKAEQIREVDKKLREANMPSVAPTEPEKPVEDSEPVVGQTSIKGLTIHLRVTENDIEV